MSSPAVNYVPPVYNLSEAHSGAVVHFHELMLLISEVLASEPQDARASARQKLIRLTNNQLGELTTDVYDELIRRKITTELGREADLPPNSAPFLAFRADYHPLRNHARQKLSTLPGHRFSDLVSDNCFELMRRYPDIKEPELAETWSEHSDAAER